MKLFYKPGACSLASHIILRETHSVFDIESVDTSTQKTASGADFNQINPKGYVPVLQLDDGDILTEGAAILQYIADQNPSANLAPVSGTVARAHLQEHLNYISSELHKAFGPLFSPKSSDDVKQNARINVITKLTHIEKTLADDRAYLLGDAYSVADAYMFVVVNWSNFTGIDLADFPKIGSYMARNVARPAVQEALRAEGLLD